MAAKARAAEDLEKFYADVLPKGQAAARQVTYLRLAELAQAANLQFDRRTFSQEQERDSQLVRLEMTMAVTGAYRDMRRFIHDLETSPDFIVWNLGGILQFGSFGCGAYGRGQTFQVSATDLQGTSPVERTFNIAVWAVHLSAGYALFQHQLVLGGGVKGGLFQVERAGPGWAVRDRAQLFVTRR